jgi:hypothetical protein
MNKIQSPIMTAVQNQIVSCFKGMFEKYLFWKQIITKGFTEEFSADPQKTYLYIHDPSFWPGPHVVSRSNTGQAFRVYGSSHLWK